MKNDEQGTASEEQKARDVLALLQGSSRERLLNALALHLAEEERRREFIKKLLSI
jgi:hypothetical protein